MQPTFVNEVCYKLNTHLNQNQRNISLDCFSLLIVWWAVSGAHFTSDGKRIDWLMPFAFCFFYLPLSLSLSLPCLLRSIFDLNYGHISGLDSVLAVGCWLQISSCHLAAISNVMGSFNPFDSSVSDFCFISHLANDAESACDIYGIVFNTSIFDSDD